MPRHGRSFQYRPIVPRAGIGAVLERTSEGLLAYYIANHLTVPFNAGDWEKQFNLTTVQVDGTTGELEVETGGIGYMRHSGTGATSRAKRMLQGVFYSPSSPPAGFPMDYPSLIAHMETGVGGDDSLGANVVVTDDGSGYGFAFTERDDNTVGAQTTGSLPYKAVDTDYRLSTFVDGAGQATGYDFAEAETLNATPSTLTAGHAGIGGCCGTDWANWKEWWDTADRNILCSGLTTGFKLKILDITSAIIKSATEVSGTATLDVLDVNLSAIVRIVVTDASDNIVQVFQPVTGGKRIVGGDVYSFAAGEALVKIFGEITNFNEGAFESAILLRIIDEVENLVEDTLKTKLIAKDISNVVNFVADEIHTIGIKQIIDNVLNFVEDKVRPLALFRLPAEVVNFNEPAPLRPLALFRLPAEILNLVEDINHTNLIAQIIDEVLNLVEGAINVLGIAKAVDEIVNFVEDKNKTELLAKNIAEIVNFVEDKLPVLVLLRILDEAVNFVEVSLPVRVMVRFKANTLNFVEATLPTQVLVRLVSEVVNVVEGIVKLVVGEGAALVELVSEALNITETNLHAFGENLVLIVQESYNFVEKGFTRMVKSNLWKRRGV